MEMDDDLRSLQEMREAVKLAKEAQYEFLSFSQKQVDYIVKQVADAAFEQAEYLAEIAVEETGMGVIEHKKIKNELGSRDVYLSIKDEKTVGIIREDPVKKITEIAYPFGVIACIIPTTNPTSTAIFKTLIALKTRNAIVVSPHPSAVKCTVAALQICKEAAEKAGAPRGVISWLTKPMMETTLELMKHKDVNLILATGGGGLVRSAYSSGKPAYGVGPGNAPVYIDKTAHVKTAVEMIVTSKSFDNGTICATEQAIIVHHHIKEITIRELKNQGGFFLNEAEKEKVENIILTKKGKLNPNIVGRSAETIAKMAGVHVPKGTRVLIAEEQCIGREIPFSIEKLAPIFPLYTANSTDEAKNICIDLLNIGGRGHSMSIHTNDQELVKTFGAEMPVSRVLVNTLASIGAAGATTGLIPSLTLGCGSYGGNISSDNITAHHLLNIKRIAFGLREVTIPKPIESKVERLEAEVNSESIDKIVSQVLNELSLNHRSIDPIQVSNMVQEIIERYEK